MVIEEPIPNFFDFIVMGLIYYLPAIVAVLAAGGFLIGYAISAARQGPVEGFYAVAKVIASAVQDIFNTSPRRILAIAILAVQESIRRKVLIVFAVFIVVMLFAGWYLDVKSDNPARLYLSFVLTASDYLVLLLALALSTFSLPADIKNRTIYTVVTKPVRATEIILGRILGFVAVGTLILTVMCGLSYLFVVRGLNHSHEMDSDLQVVVASESGGQSVERGTTTTDAFHQHEVMILPDGTGETDRVMGHTHRVRRIGEGESARFEIGPPEGALAARVVRRGALRFLDRAGAPGTGVNVGEEWGYRSYVEGGTLATAIWSFDNMTPSRYPDGLDLELTLRVFRTHKGNIEQGIRGTITVRNPDPAAPIQQSEPLPFTAREFSIDRQFIPRVLQAADGTEIDLFKDLTSDGRIELWVRCSEPGQYFGMAAPDLYVLESTGNFGLNFIKAYYGFWLQMLMVTTFGVTFSALLSGPVAFMATLSTIVIGLFRGFIVSLVKGVVGKADYLSGGLEGGGPIEALIRNLRQLNLSAELGLGRPTELVIQFLDRVFVIILDRITVSLPDYVNFGATDFVASGFNIEPGLLAVHTVKALVYFVLVSLIGYFFLKTREVAA